MRYLRSAMWKDITSHFVSCMQCVSALNYGAQLLKLRRGRVLKFQAVKSLEARVPSSRNQLVALIVFSFTLTSCVSNARLVNETATGGTVLYTYVEEQDVLHSPGRSDALRLLEEKCPTGYNISREGRISLIDKAVDRAWMGQVSRDGQVSQEKRWAIQFTCN
jgi:hypothetical protein